MFSSLRESSLGVVLSFILSELYYEKFTMSSILKDHYAQDAALTLHLYHFSSPRFRQAIYAYQIQ